MKSDSMIVLLVLVVFTLIPAHVVAMAPTQADFDECNKMATSKTSSPSASPQTAASDAKPQGGPQAAPSDKPAAEARVEKQADQLRGIATASKDDAGYREAYRDCMKRRGF
jgi:hypothetical protein